MNNAFVAGSNLDGFQPTRSINGRSKDEIPIGVGATRGKDEWFFRFYNFSRTAELPAGDKLWRARQVGGSALDSSLLDPPLNKGNLLVGQAEFVDKSQLLRLREPRGHEAFGSYDGDLPRARLCISIGK